MLKNDPVAGALADGISPLVQSAAMLVPASATNPLIATSLPAAGADPLAAWLGAPSAVLGRSIIQRAWSAVAEWLSEPSLAHDFRFEPNDGERIERDVVMADTRRRG